MDIRLDQKTAFITGASRGIGRAIALEFAKSGANVIITARSVNDLETLAAEIRALGQKAVAIPCDLNEPSSLDAAVARAQSELGGRPCRCRLAAKVGVVSRRSAQRTHLTNRCRPPR